MKIVRRVITSGPVLGGAAIAPDRVVVWSGYGAVWWVQVIARFVRFAVRLVGFGGWQAGFTVRFWLRTGRPRHLAVQKNHSAARKDHFTAPENHLAAPVFSVGAREV